MEKKKITPPGPVILAVLFAFSLVQTALSQDIDTSLFSSTENMQLYMEYLAESSQGEEELDDLPVLAQKMNLIDINNADENILKNICGLTEWQIRNLQEYKRRYGPLLTIYELMLIDGFGPDVRDKIQNRVSVENTIIQKKIPAGQLLQSGKHDIFVRYSRTIEKKKGYSGDSAVTSENRAYKGYMGSPGYIYMRYHFNALDRIQLGLTAEKDPGEEFFTGTQKNGFDYYSGNLLLNNFGFLKAFVIGDYQLDFGQGLTLSTGTRFRNWLEITQGIRSAKGISRHSGTNEFNFLRGTAATMCYGPIELTAFFSSRKKDASSMYYDTINDFVSVSSFYTSGLHRTMAECSKKGELTEQIYGGHLMFKGLFFETGFTLFRTHYGASFRNQDKAYDFFGFTGTDNLNAGLDMRMIIKNFSLFGEFSMSRNRARAVFAGIKCNPFPDMTLIIHYRNYQKNYQDDYCKSFGENTQNRNEKGLFIGITTNLSRRLSLQAYADSHTFRWLKYRVSSPSKGYDYYIQVNYSPSAFSSLYFFYKQQTKQQDKQGALTYTVQTGEILKENIRFHLSYSVLKCIRLENTFDVVTVKNTDGGCTHGYVVSQDISVKPVEQPWSFTFRYAIFDTESYDERIYSYEYDVLYSFSVPAYYNKGTRIILMGTFHFNKHVDVWLRMARTCYLDKTSVGTGLEAIDGRSKTDIRLQLRWRF